LIYILIKYFFFKKERKEKKCYNFKVKSRVQGGYQEFNGNWTIK
jgi:hypothetical protein